MIRNALAVISLGLLNICWGFVGSMQAPFFPIEAEKKGATASQFSPIFGIIHLATVVTSPFMAKVITRVGLGNVFKLSLVLIFVAAISFGCLTYVDDLVLFLTLAYFLRILAGVGGAALWTAMLSLLLASSGKVYSLVDATFGLGFTLGPVLGSFLYVAGGFITPFVVTASLLLFSGVLSVITCKQLTDHAEAQISDTSLGAMIPILKSPEAAVSLMSAATASLTVGFVESTLEMHLETFSLSVTTIGLCFLTMSVAFSAVTFIAGYWSDRVLYPGHITIIGLFLLLITFLLIGPAPYLPLSPSLELTLPSLVTQGAGSAACIVSTYSSCLRATLNIPGYSRSATTSAVVSGLWTSVFAFGNFLGPTISGILYEEVGYQWGTVVVHSVLGLMFLVNVVTAIKVRRRDKRQNSNSKFKFC